MQTDNLLIQQNNLLQQQNNLLLQMNNLLQAKNSATTPILTGNHSEEFIENINTDEIRSGFLVTSHRKKLWNVQIGLINEFARICKKHNLRWFAGYGTLLGAARHKGFIPWDDDVDLVMFRPDYEKFKKVAVEELKFPYYLDDPFNYRWEKDKDAPDVADLPFVPFGGHWPFGIMFKIKNSLTTMLESPKVKNIHRGIFIDIFPFDPVPPFKDIKHQQMFDVEGILYFAIFKSAIIENALRINQPLPIDLDFLKQFLKLSYHRQGIYYENLLNEHFFDSQYVGRIERNFQVPNPVRYKAEFFDKVEYLPFEKIELPVPSNYDEILTASYGDWHKMVYTHSHAQIYSTDIPYLEYFGRSNYL